MTETEWPQGQQYPSEERQQPGWSTPQYQPQGDFSFSSQSGGGGKSKLPIVIVAVVAVVVLGLGAAFFLLRGGSNRSEGGTGGGSGASGDVAAAYTVASEFMQYASSGSPGTGNNVEKMALMVNPQLVDQNEDNPNWDLGLRGLARVAKSVNQKTGTPVTCKQVSAIPGGGSVMLTVECAGPSGSIQGHFSLSRYGVEKKYYVDSVTVI